MSDNVFDTLKERGFFAQVTDEEAVRRKLAEEKVTFYIGFDGTADSLHAGSLVTIMAMMYLQRAGHRPIGLVGGGTTMVGDPSGKTEMRQMLSYDTIEANPRNCMPNSTTTSTSMRARLSPKTTPTGCLISIILRFCAKLDAISA